MQIFIKTKKKLYPTLIENVVKQNVMLLTEVFNQCYTSFSICYNKMTFRFTTFSIKVGYLFFLVLINICILEI